jgi:sugar phosphate isomerase/epimerase
MKIIAKSQFNANIYDKVLKGAPAIELHLEEDFVNNSLMWDQQIVQDVPIAAVHAPLIKGDDINIEIPHNRVTLIKTCDLARKIADAQGHSVMVICHLGTDPDILMQLGVYEDLVSFMRDLADTYEMLEFAVENVPLFDSETPNFEGHVGFRTIRFDSAVRFVNDVCHPRVGTCLDTCHAIMDINLMNSLGDYLYITNNKYDELLNNGLAKFFDANKNVIKWMHLSNAKSHGLANQHGLPFTDDDLNILQIILQLYFHCGYQCPVVLEVREKDYSDAQNYLITRKNLENQLKEFE